MSKYLKELITQDLRQRWGELNDAVLVSVEGMDANANNRLRKELVSRNIQLMVVKNSLARRASEGTPLSSVFADLDGTAALAWGGEDAVDLAKQVTQLGDEDEFEALTTRGGLMDGQPLTAENVKEVSKWPSRTEQLSLLSGQILSVGSNLSGQLIGTASMLASQIDQVGEEADA